MTRAAEIQTESPDLQALFDQDWTSGKYRRPKCSKADFYAGWLVAYERFKSVAPVEKISVVEKTAPKRTARAAVAVKEQYEQRMVPCDGEWVVQCEYQGTDHDKTCSGGESWRVSAARIVGPLRDGEVMHRYLNICGNKEDSHNRMVTYYQGGLPLKHEAPKGLAPNAGNKYGAAVGQAIPDALLRKLAIKAGRPKIAP